MTENTAKIFVCFLSKVHQNCLVFFNHKLLLVHCDIDMSRCFNLALGLKRNNNLSLVLKMGFETDFHLLEDLQKLNFVF